MLKVAKEEGQYVVSLFQVNKLNTLFSELISDQLKSLVGQPERRVVFNLDGITFIDSSGFNTLLKATDIARKVGSQFLICNIGPEVQELLDLTGLHNTLNITEDIHVEEKLLMELDD